MASEIMMRCSPSMRNRGADCTYEMPSPSSMLGRPDRANSSLYPRTISTISRASTQARLTARAVSPSRPMMARMMASPSMKTLVAVYFERSRVQPAFDEGPSEAGGVAHIGLDNDVVTDFLFAGLLLICQQKLVQRTV